MAEALSQLAEFAERIGRCEPALGLFSIGPRDRDLRPARLEFQERLGSQKAEPPNFLAPDHAFKEKRWGGPLDPSER